MIRFSLLWIFLIASCSHINTMNLKPHTFGQKPAKIIWIQVAGLSEEHLAMLRFGMSEANTKTAFEQMSCVGKMWNYNLFKLRPNSIEGFRAQLLGSPRVTGTCSDLESIPVWDHLNDLGYKTAILEGMGREKDSLNTLFQCQKKMDDVVLWRMSKHDGKNVFHYQENLEYSFGKTYYDKSCQKGTCYTSLYDNVKGIEQYFNNRSKKSLFIIRELSYATALENKNILKANETLLEVEKILNHFLTKYKNSEDVLILVTSSATQNLEFPSQGHEWAKFIQKGKGVLFKKRSLLSPVFAKGAAAENFCGIFDEYEVLRRLFWMTRTSILEDQVKKIF